MCESARVKKLKARSASMKKIFAIAGLIGIAYEAGELIEWDLSSAELVFLFLVIFLGKWGYDALKDAIEERTKRSDTRRQARLHKSISLMVNVPSSTMSGKVSQLLYEYVRCRYGRAAGFKSRQLGSPPFETIRIRSTLVSWVNIEIRENLVEYADPHIHMHLKRRTIYAWCNALGGTILAVTYLFIHFTGALSDDNVRSFVVKMVVVAICIFPVVFVTSWQSAKRWFPPDRLLLLREDLRQVARLGATPSIDRRLVAANDNSLEVALRLANEHKERDLSRQDIRARWVARGAILIVPLMLVAIVGRSLM
jgi:hypothetical protein